MDLNHIKHPKVTEPKQKQRQKWDPLIQVPKHQACKSQSVIEHSHSFILKACLITCRQLYLQNNANRFIFIFSICTRFTSNGFHEFVVLSKTNLPDIVKYYSLSQSKAWDKTANSTTETKRLRPTPIWQHCTTDPWTSCLAIGIDSNDWSQNIVKNEWYETAIHLLPYEYNNWISDFTVHYYY